MYGYTADQSGNSSGGYGGGAGAGGASNYDYTSNYNDYGSSPFIYIHSSYYPNHPIFKHNFILGNQQDSEQGGAESTGGYNKPQYGGSNNNNGGGKFNR